MEYNYFEFGLFANEMRMPTFAQDENPIDGDMLNAEETAESEMETSQLVESVMQLRLKLRYLHLVECEHFRQIEAGMPAYRRMSMSRDAGPSCRARHSLDF